MNRKYVYGGLSAEVEPAARVKGVIIRTLHGVLMFRVYRESENFTDYELRHGDLSVRIHEDEMAVFYKVGEHDILDHSPQVLGLSKVGE